MVLHLASVSELCADGVRGLKDSILEVWQLAGPSTFGWAGAKIVEKLNTEKVSLFILRLDLRKLRVTSGGSPGGYSASNVCYVSECVLW
jgi:hypothetical protein